ncbi:hypothetical protein BG011_004855 [Mortierella polycephala]|uniref:Rho-GAP domain-containing protein n=1 Tax=Mortierella polycephala TaxID=41804 RepID=A0A9P6U1S3_9FUNG|nr:hypothetical protein BG011_004855 [Mortierella polycephala]
MMVSHIPDIEPSPKDRHLSGLEDVIAQFNSIALPYDIMFPDRNDNQPEAHNPPSVNPVFAQKTLQNVTDSPIGTRVGDEDGKQTNPRSLPQSLPTPLSTTDSSRDYRSSDPSTGNSYSYEAFRGSLGAGEYSSHIADRIDTDIQSKALGKTQANGKIQRRLHDSGKNIKSKKTVKNDSKLAKGWKRLRQSLRHSTDPGQISKYASRSLSSIADNGPCVSLTVSSLAIRNAVSDMDHPREIGFDDMLNFGPGFASGFTSKFGSGSIKDLHLKPSSTSSLSDVDMEAVLVGITDGNRQRNLEGGAMVVDIENVMSLEEMQQRGNEDRANLQQQQQISASTEQPQTGLGHQTGECQPQNTDHRVAHQDHVQVPQSKHIEIKDEPSDESSIRHQERVSTNTDRLDTGADVGPHLSQKEQSLSRGLLASQHWRLSTHGSPDVSGSMRECKTVDPDANEAFLQQLMHESGNNRNVLEHVEEQAQLERDDNAFRIPLQQSVQLASAMFDNGQKIPLVLHYVVEELRTRGNVITEINSLFPENWGEQDDGFEALVDIFDKRPFGQGIDISISGACNPASSGGKNISETETTNCVPSMDVDAKSQQDGPEDIQQVGKNVGEPSISSRDLSRIILRFFVDLPEPLIPQDVFTTFSAMVQLQTLESIKVQATSLLVQLLAPESRQLLQFLLEFVNDVILQPFGDALQGPECASATKTTLQSSSPGKSQEEAERQSRQYTETFERISEVFGVVIVHAAFPKTASCISVSTSHSQSSLYRHYKREFEQKALQEQNASAIQKAKLVFQTLLKYRVSIFGPSSFSLGPSIGPEDHAFEDRKNSQKYQSRDRIDACNHEQGCGSASDADSDYEYQSDSALFDLTSRRYTNRQRVHPRSKGCLHRRPFKNASGWSRRNKLRLHSALRTEQGKNTIGDGTLCNSAVEATSNVDVLAIAAMQEHMARTLRSKKHLPWPSVASLHSIMAEAESVVEEKHAQGRLNNRASGVEGQLDGAGPAVLQQMSLADAADGDEEGSDDAELGPAVPKPRRQFGFMDFLQEPLDRKYKEREMKLVEREILQSEITTQYLATNLAGLYPSSSPSPIPPVILPSARSSILKLFKAIEPITATTPAQVVVSPNDAEPCLEDPCSRNRVLTLTPQEQIQLPQDHRPSDDCLCSYCTTVVRPSKVPVLTRKEYELAELQSQCDAKDQHITELLKTVQSLQEQVNVLNAKLLFLHDHHTTRPMRRRTLVQNTQPVMPYPCGAGWFSRNKQPVQAQQSSDSEESLGQRASGTRTGSTMTSMTTYSASSNTPSSPTKSPEGFRSGSNIDGHLSQHQVLPHAHSQRTHFIDEDEAISYLEQDDNRQLPPSIVTNPMHHIHAIAPLASMQRPKARPQSDAHVVHPAQSFYNMLQFRDPRYETELEKALRDVEEADEEPEREGEDLLDEYYYTDAYKTMDQQLYRRPILPVPAPPHPMSSDQYKKHHRMSLPIHNLISKRISLGNSIRWRGRATAA